MKISISQIPQEGLFLEDTLKPEDLDLAVKDIEFTAPVRVKAQVVKITNVVTVDLDLDTRLSTICSRCLEKIRVNLDRKLMLNYPVKSNQDVINLNEDIRQELVLDYPVKPLCNPNCKGLCPKCGKNLNQGGCSCGTT